MSLMPPPTIEIDRKRYEQLTALVCSLLGGYGYTITRDEINRTVRVVYPEYSKTDTLRESPESLNALLDILDQERIQEQFSDCAQSALGVGLKAINIKRPIINSDGCIDFFDFHAYTTRSFKLTSKGFGDFYKLFEDYSYKFALIAKMRHEIEEKRNITLVFEKDSFTYYPKDPSFQTAEHGRQFVYTKCEIANFLDEIDVDSRIINNDATDSNFPETDAIRESEIPIT